MCSRSRAALLGTVVSGLFALSATAGATDDPARDEARKLAYAGVAAYQATEYQTASDKLEKAFAMLPAPSVGLYSARALAKLGKLTEAAARYRQISQLVITAGERNVQEVARKNAAADLAALIPLIPGLRIQIEGATVGEVQVVLDGNIVSESELAAEIELDPGTHELQGRRGTRVFKSTIELHEAEHSSAVLRFPADDVPALIPTPPSRYTADSAPSPGHPPSSLRTAGWVGLAAGSGGLVLSGVGLLVALGAKPGGCTNHVCGGAVSSYNTWRAVSTVGFYGGAVLGVAGATLLLAAPKSNSNEQALMLTVRANGASLSGSF